MSITTARVKIVKYKDNLASYQEDIVVKEAPLTVCCNNVEVATLLCSPEHEEELAIGFLVAAGLIKSKEKITAILHNTEENAVFIKYKDENNQSVLKRYMTTGCGMGMLLCSEEELMASDKYNGTLSLEVKNIILLMKELQHKSELYLNTGGVHSAALSDGKEVIVFREDIGRHNAVDKIIGYATLNDIPLNDKVIISSGRISSEIVLKLAKVGVGGIISRSAPMDRAVEIAKNFNMTVIGFARGKRMNIYAGEERIRELSE